MEVRKSEKCGFHLKHSNFLVGFRCLRWKMSPSFNIILFSGPKKVDKLHPPAYIDVFLSAGRLLQQPGWLHSSRSRCFTSSLPFSSQLPWLNWAMKTWKTAQKRLVRGFVWGMKSYPVIMGINFINYEIRIPSFSPTRISMESIRPVFFSWLNCFLHFRS